MPPRNTKHKRGYDQLSWRRAPMLGTRARGGLDSAAGWDAGFLKPLATNGLENPHDAAKEGFYED
jgi:hypothetical protein